MDKYKINYIYNDKNDINDIFIKVLNKSKWFVKIKNVRYHHHVLIYLLKEVRIVREFK